MLPELMAMGRGLDRIAENRGGTIPTLIFDRETGHMIGPGAGPSRRRSWRGRRPGRTKPWMTAHLRLGLPLLILMIAHLFLAQKHV
jgi:hypothetical protein